MTLTVGIFVFDGVEVLDFAGPYEVFTTASRVAQRQRSDAEAPFFVFTVAGEKALTTARAGLAVMPDWNCRDHPPIDVLVIPGGVVDTEQRRPQTIDWIRQTAASSRITASVCTGAFLLAAADLLHQREATTHWEDVADLRRQFPTTTVLENRRWVEHDAVITSAGISAGIHMSLHLVSRLASRDLAQATARQMEFDWCSEP